MDLAATVEASALFALSALTLRTSIGAASAVYRKQRDLVLRRTQIEQFEAFAGRSLARIRLRRKTSELAWQGSRKFRVAWREYEDDKHDVCSFYLVPADRRPLSPFRPGQHLSLEIPIPNANGQASIRQYSISSSATESRYYRITVKRNPTVGSTHSDDMRASCANFLHDQIMQGGIVDVFAPTGAFVVSPHDTRPLVLIAGGVGLTPILCMLRSIAEGNPTRTVWLFYGVRNRSEHIMQNELQWLREQCPRLRLVVFYSQPSAACVSGVDYDIAGRVQVRFIKPLLKARNYVFYVCGPTQMNDDITRDLKAWGVADESIHVEHFTSPAQPLRLTAATAPIELDHDDSNAAGEQPAGQINVSFAKSGKSVRWSPGSGSLLELAEACGIKTRCSCRQGICGTCLTAVRDGEVDYLREPANRPAAGAVLPCIARPKSDLVLDL